MGRDKHIFELKIMNIYYPQLSSFLLTPLKYQVFENIMENGAFALLKILWKMEHLLLKSKQMLHFP